MLRREDRMAGRSPTGDSKGAPEPSSARSLADWQKGTVEAWEEQRRKPWQVYVDAELGFRNHWYPAFYAHELLEADVSPNSGEPVELFKSVTILGERILFRRVDGDVYAVQDWCLHRGVPFSSRPECYTKSTLTCWYHGFTYDIRDGILKTVVTDPTCSLIGKIGLRSYKVQERKGIVWIFIGDLDPAPPLEYDVPPGFLEPDFYLYSGGYCTEVACNWRPAAENGFDPAHAYLHRNANLTKKFKVAFPFGETGLSKNRGMEVVQDGPGPWGVKLLRGGATSIWEASIDDVKIETRFRPGGEGVLPSTLPEVSVWLPGTLKVDPFPIPGVVNFEFYVPVDEKTHRYMMTWGATVTNDEERERFEDEIRNVWGEMVWSHFADDDVFARENLAEFYSDADGWFRERLFGPDVVITSWRTLASHMNRGVQRRGMQ
jgi:carbazole 1,9a-dioxygenase terminal dioxygenase component